MLLFYVIYHNSDVVAPSHILKYQARKPFFCSLSQGRINNKLPEHDGDWLQKTLLAGYSSGQCNLWFQQWPKEGLSVPPVEPHFTGHTILIKSERNTRSEWPSKLVVESPSLQAFMFSHTNWNSISRWHWWHQPSMPLCWWLGLPPIRWETEV